jgi:EmrB/QacA subfamily drug resistance transporter
MNHQAVETPITASPSATEPRRRGGWVVPAIIGSVLLMQTLESTIMANAVPAIARALHEEPLRLNMAMTMFLLAAAVALPISGWLADKYGAQKILITSMICFAASSIGCGFAQSLTQLVVGRIFQGASIAMLVPVGRLVLLRTTPRSELVGALSILTIPPVVGPLIGPLLGGLIVTYFNWRWIFFINIPIAAICIVLVRAFVPDVKEDSVPPVDIRGVVLTGIGLAALVFGFDNLGRPFLSGGEIAGLFAVAFISFAIYVRHARRTPNAIVDLNIFRIRTFAASTMGGAFMRVGVGALPFLLAMLLQVGFGMSAFAAGGLIFLSGVGSLSMKGVAPPMLRRFGFRRVLTVNGVITAMTFLAFAFVRPNTSHWELMLIVAAGGFFRSLQFTAMQALAFADIEPELMSRASTTTSMTQQVVQSFGIGLAATLLHFLQLWRREPHLTWQAVSPAFAVMAALCLVSVVWFARLPAGAGDEINGRLRA